MGNVFAEGYQPEEWNESLTDGDYLLKVKEVTTGWSKNHDAQLIIEFSIPGVTFTIKQFFTKNEYFNKFITRFFDCFKIKRGEFNKDIWIGKTGLCHLRKGDKYMELERMIVEGGISITQNEKLTTEKVATGYVVPVVENDLPIF
jgi:hypothetical protein